MTSWFGVIAALYGAIGVSMGAFGAHGLRDKVEPRMLEVWSTAAQYQLWHALALLFVAFWMSREAQVSTALQVSAWAFAIGILIFSGSLYALVLSGMNWLGAVTPIGGTALIVAWLALAYALVPKGL